MSSGIPRTVAIAPATEAAVRLLRMSGLAAVLLLLLALMGAMLVPTRWPLWLTLRQVFLQDLWLAAALLAIAGLSFAGSFLKTSRLEAKGWMKAVSAIALILVCFAGRYLVLGGFDLTRDEQMVSFDAWILSQGSLAWPLPKAWQANAGALNLMFMLPVEHPIAWVSAYLPGNALLHAAVGKLADPAWTAPLLTGLSVPLLWSLCRKIWPGDFATATLVLVLFIASGQVLLNGMTTYSMAAHLFCNLAWLRLFLAERRGTDFAALALGWFATGLHQPLFHPLFVAPFLLVLLLERRWQRLGLFTAGYLAIGLFWLSWPGQILALVSDPLPQGMPAGVDYLTRLRDVFAVNWISLSLLGANLLRFITWQHAALLPLLLAAWPAIRRDRFAAALAIGLILPAAILTVILPWQGNGFGYRYLHPVLGNALLLAGLGWRELAPLHHRLRPALAVATASTVLLLVPLWLWMGHARYAPFVHADAVIEASGADYLVLDSGAGVAYASMVFNRPDLSNRPLRLAADQIRDPVALARRICRPGTTVAMATNSFFHPGAAYFKARPKDTANARLPALRAPYEAAGCRVVLMR